MRVRANLECVEPDDLRVWLDETRSHVDGRTITRENWRSYDSARRFLDNPAMRRLQVDTWLTRGDCYSSARLHVRLARIAWGRMWDGIGPVRRTLDDQLEGLEDLAEALRYRELARGKWPDDHSHPIYDERLANLHSHPVHEPQRPGPAPVAEAPRPPRRTFAGTWHWDDARAGIDAVIAHLPQGHRLAERLEGAEVRSRSDSMLVYRWGVILAEWHGLEDPCAYGRALTDSVAIHRPSLATREALGRGELHEPSPDELASWRDFRIKSLTAERLPVPEEMWV